MSGRARVDRWRTAAEALAELRRNPGLTRVELARRLGLASASATEITARLRELGWLDEQRAPSTGRGRPTTVLSPAADGPVVLAVDLRFEGWRCAWAGLDGQPGPVRSGRYRRRDPDDVVAALRTVVAEQAAAAPGPVQAVGIAVAAAVVDGRAHFPDRPWLPAEPGRVADGLDVPAVVGNDAALAGVAEVRCGAATDAHTALFLIVEVGVGGALLLDGHPQAGTHGAAGEFGHLPFGDPDVACPCGARGCWSVDVGAGALVARVGEPETADPSDRARALLDHPGSEVRAAARQVAAALGRGTAGLVNAHDPDVVVLGGLGPALRRVADDSFAAAYTAGLMTLHRPAPPPVRDATYGTDAALRGAAAVALDEATSAAGLARLAARSPEPTALAP